MQNTKLICHCQKKGIKYGTIQNCLRKILVEKQQMWYFHQVKSDKLSRLIQEDRTGAHVRSVCDTKMTKLSAS